MNEMSLLWGFGAVASICVLAYVVDLYRRLVGSPRAIQGGRSPIVVTIAVRKPTAAPLLGTRSPL